MVLDLGGSKFKVLQVKVREGVGIRKGEVEMEEKTYPLPTELRTGRGTEVSEGDKKGDKRRWNSRMIRKELL